MKQIFDTIEQEDGTVIYISKEKVLCPACHSMVMWDSRIHDTLRSPKQIKIGKNKFKCPVCLTEYSPIK